MLDLAVLIANPRRDVLAADLVVGLVLRSVAAPLLDDYLDLYGLD